MKLNVLTAAILTSGITMFASTANAGMTTDGHGNVGYDSYDECVMAVKDGSAKFYTPYTYQKPMRRAGEATVKKMRLSEVMIPQNVVNSNKLSTANYTAGACDLGVGQSNGRYGVSGALVGKYVPIAADMPVNVYMDKNGNPVRLSMQQCDNHFGSQFPMPIVGTGFESPNLVPVNTGNVTPADMRTTPAPYTLQAKRLGPDGELLATQPGEVEVSEQEALSTDAIVVQPLNNQYRNANYQPLIMGEANNSNVTPADMRITAVPITLQEKIQGPRGELIATQPGEVEVSESRRFVVR